MRDLPDISILPLTADTVEQVAALEQICFSDPWSSRAIRNELENPLCVFFTAMAGDQVAGYAGMYHIVDEGHINNIAVAPPFRRRGVGAALLQALIDFGEVQQLCLLTLEVRASNLGAVALYRAFGFCEAGRRPGYYHSPPEDALLLTKVL